MIGQQAEPPEWDSAKGADHTLTEVDEWLSGEPMRELVHAFGGQVSRSYGSAFAEYLEAFAAAHWDYRRGSERDTARRVVLSPKQERAALRAAKAFGMTEAKAPRRDRYDAVLMLGGMVRACLVRPRYAAQLVKEGLLAQEFVALGAFRRLSDQETTLATMLGVSTSGEYEAMVDGVRLAFGTMLSQEPSVDGEDVTGQPFRSWRVTTWGLTSEGSPGLPNTATASVVAVPSSVPGQRRANTSDTYNYWANQIRRESSKSVLLITNPIYVVYQGCTAILNLGLQHDLDVEIVGASRQASDLGQVTQQWTAQDYLQEIRASIGALVRLRSSLEDTL